MVKKLKQKLKDQERTFERFRDKLYKGDEKKRRPSEKENREWDSDAGSRSGLGLGSNFGTKPEPQEGTGEK